MYADELKKIKEKGLYRSLTAHLPGEGPVIYIDQKPYLSFSSNNYLGLANHPGIIKEGQSALEKYGSGSGSSRLIAGTTPLHAELEQSIARFKKTEAALSFSSGYLANLALMTALPEEGDLLLADRFNHASLMDGCRLSRADFKVFRHKDIDQLGKLLSKKKSGQSAFIVTEGVFSMDGDIAPLPEIVKLAKQFQATLILDDAHGFGVMGSHGRGTAEHFGIESDMEIQMGTLGKAVGVHGAFVAGSHLLIELLINRAKPFIYTTALPAAIPAMCIASLNILASTPSLRAALIKNQDYFCEGLIESGFSIQNHHTPIIPILIGDAEKTVEFSRALFDAGIFIPAIRPPTVPRGTSRLRVSLSALHSQEHIDICLNHLKICGKKFGIL
ncbi:MAG: 8-amino-7-oxononanoate synthase [Nitrospirae bacterium]|nr:8-amino-7-oxononanoate synthase [Nitrospirota bacterium]MBI3606270.1 8-amino-7-oxononanoate synthase [Nitrospirota bacterium]